MRSQNTTGARENGRQPNHFRPVARFAGFDAYLMISILGLRPMLYAVARSRALLRTVVRRNAAIVIFASENLRIGLCFFAHVLTQAIDFSGFIGKVRGHNKLVCGHVP